MKLTDIFLTSAGNMMRSKLRSGLTIIAIFIGAFTLTLTNGIGNGVSSFIDKQFGSIGAADVLIINPSIDQPGPGEIAKYNPEKNSSSTSAGFSIPVLDSNDIEDIASTDGLSSVEPVVSVVAEYFTVGEDKYNVNIASTVPGMKFDLVSGRTYDLDSDKSEAVITVNQSEGLGFDNHDDAIGETLTFGVMNAAREIKEVNAEIVGVQRESLIGGGGVSANNSLLESIHELQFAGMPEQAKTQYAAATAKFNKDATDEEVQAIKDDLKESGYSAMTVEDTVGSIKDVVSGITVVLNFFAAIALLAASFGIVNTLLMAVQERTKEIGLMKAMGMRASRVFLLFSIEATLLGFWGSLLGSVVAIVVGLIANDIASNTVLKGLPGFDLMAFPVSSILIIMLIVMAIAFLAGTLPARRASKKDPIESLRYE